MWPCVHVENYAYNTTPEEVRELYSQVWRNGGSGFHLYIPDTANAGKKKGDNRLTQWGSPRRYRAILEIMDRAAHQNKLKFPADEGCRVLFANYSHMAFASPRAVQDPVEACYTLLGPLARSWFTFIDEHRIVTPRSAASAKAIYLPRGRFMDAATRRRLEAFVAKGGVLIVADPHAFEFDIDGSRTATERTRLTGAVLTGPKSHGSRFVTVKPHPMFPGIDKPERFLLLSTPNTLELKPGAVALGEFDDGSPAIVLKKSGAGMVLYFAFQPFSMPAVASDGWRDFFTSLQRGLGFSVRQDIWRFKFPPFKTVDPPGPTGICLTNNYVEFREDEQHLLHNADVDGSYTLSPLPDAAPDDGGGHNIPFSRGDLTDRIAWPQLEKVKPAGYQPYAESIVKWGDTWESPGDVTVTFDFKEPRAILRARIFFSGFLPDVRLEGSADGKTWTSLGTAQGRNAGEDVLDLTVTGRPSKARRFARLIFGPRTSARTTLAELEVWGKE